MSYENEFYVVRKSLEQSLRELPPLPTAVSRVLQEMQQAEPQAANIERIIAGDQALASKVLRVVNSAYYGLSRQVTNVGQAIIILGLQQVRNIVLSVGSMSTFSAKTPKQQETMQRFWKHSFGSASTSVLVAGKLGWDRKMVETIFTAGILHDIGRLFLFCNFTNTYDRLIEIAIKQGKTFEVVEQELLGTSHAKIGGVIAEKWGLPPSLVTAIANHEGPFTEEIEPITAVVHYVDWLNKDEYFNLPELISPLDESVQAWLNISDEENAKFKELTAVKVKEAGEMYGMAA